MKVEIYSVYLLSGDSKLFMKPDTIMDRQSESLAKLQGQVNSALEAHPSAIVQWLQHAAASSLGNFVQLTAIVSY